ncbi:MAG: hypothetical protein HY698_03965 [Deltaproteobacteria bacterium]|nr:hypothetical protein [Deltaproteobacteria bacterium]
MAMLHWKITSRDPAGTHAVLYGEINEATDFGELTLLRGRIVFDLTGIRRINSFGVRQFLGFLDALHDQKVIVEVEKCSPAVVSQLNMLPEFSRKVSVRSVQAPVECPKCLGEREVLVEIPRGSRRPPQPIYTCEECGCVLEMSEPEDRYYAFLSEH